MNSGQQHAVAASHVFDGVAVQRDAAVVMQGARIVAVLPRAELPAAVPVHALPDEAWLAPGFIDIQVNGGGDVLFNDEPNVEGIRAIAAAHRRFGTTSFLPTLISDTREKMLAAHDAVVAASKSEPGVIGIHFEGPFLSPERPGVHSLRHIRAPTAEDHAVLMKPRRGATVVTLAPERVAKGFIHGLASAGIRVCLGHSMATYAETCAAMAEGLSGFTHLFNAMRPIASREPGPIVAALESPDVWFGMIADGWHVDPAVLRLALRGSARPMLVTDAMPPVGGQRSTFKLYGEETAVRNGRCMRPDGTLAGAFLTMAGAIRNCVTQLGIALPEALRFATANPAAFIGLDGTLGRLAAGYRADMVALTSEVQVLETWIAGKPAGGMLSDGHRKVAQA